jgi:hypothetical protein
VHISNGSTAPRLGIAASRINTAVSSTPPRRQRLSQERAILICARRRPILGESIPSNSPRRPQPCSEGKLIGAKPPLQTSHVSSIRTDAADREVRPRSRALQSRYDSKLRACRAVAARVRPVLTAPDRRCRRVAVVGHSSRFLGRRTEAPRRRFLRPKPVFIDRRDKARVRSCCARRLQAGGRCRLRNPAPDC